MFMLSAEGFHCDLQFHGVLSVDGHELIVFEPDDVAAGFRDNRGDAGQFARTVRQQDGDRKDTVAQDQPLADD